MVRKKQKKNINYLVVLTSASLILIVLVNHFVFNNGFDILNTLSTTATMLVFSLIMVIWLFAVVFWLKMLVDAAQQKRWAWFAAILFVCLFAVLYLFIKKPKLTSASFIPTAWVALGLFLLIWGMQLYPHLTYRINPVDLSALQSTGRQFKAKVETRNLSGYVYKGPTICKELKLDDGTYYIDVTGGAVAMTDESDTKLNYRLGYTGDSESEFSSGWQEFRETEPQKIKYVDVTELIGAGPSEISGPLSGCTIEFWSSN